MELTIGIIWLWLLAAVCIITQSSTAKTTSRKYVGLEIFPRKTFPVYIDSDIISVPNNANSTRKNQTKVLQSLIKMSKSHQSDRVPLLGRMLRQGHRGPRTTKPNYRSKLAAFVLRKRYLTKPNGKNTTSQTEDRYLDFIGKLSSPVPVMRITPRRGLSHIGQNYPGSVLDFVNDLIGLSKKSSRKKTILHTDLHSDTQSENFYHGGIRKRAHVETITPKLEEITPTKEYMSEIWYPSYVTSTYPTNEKMDENFVEEITADLSRYFTEPFVDHNFYNLLMSNNEVDMERTEKDIKEIVFGKFDFMPVA